VEGERVKNEEALGGFALLTEGEKKEKEIQRKRGEVSNTWRLITKNGT